MSSHSRVTLEQVLRSLDADPTCYRARGEVFAAALRERYSPDEQKRALLAAWDDILGRHAQAQGA